MPPTTWSHHRAGVDADADLQWLAVRAGVPRHLVADGQRHLGHLGVRRVSGRG